MEVYKLTCTYPREEQFNLISQLRRAATSVPTNIVEGCGRFTQKDFAKFLQDAFGSAQEIEYLLFLSSELNYMNNEKYNVINAQVNEVKAMLLSLLALRLKLYAYKKMNEKPQAFCFKL